MIGRRLAQYEIVEKIGQGGMGEVWRARDTTLDRDVAIKILPEAFARDAERLARFEREARLLASLNHPGIAAVHGLHDQDGFRFLAMEFVPGENLAQRLKRGPLGLDESLFLGVQVAEALEAAHAQGVVHRDLKPANIVLTPHGKAKVLDFGLAKALDPAVGSDPSAVSTSPTATSAGTVAGVILGTAAYMSPEQARGKSLDRRTDLWSFGCVLYEALTAHRLYGGESVSDSLGAILHKEPDWSRLPQATPPAVRWLLRRCLTKDRTKRLHDVADARIELEHAIEDPTGSMIGLDLPSSASGPSAPGAATRRTRLAMLLAVLALALGAVGGWTLRGDPAAPPLRKLDLGFPVTTDRGDVPELAISRDGGKVAFAHAGELWVRALDTQDARRLDDVEDARAPFWSPDGTWISYFAGTRLWKVPASGGRPVPLADLGETLSGGYGGSWGEDGRIIVSLGSTGLLEVPERGGDPREWLPPNEGESDLHEPYHLPGNGGLLFVAHPAVKAPGVLALVRDGERRTLLVRDDERIRGPVYDRAGFVLFERSGGTAPRGVWALPFEVDSGEATGEPFLVAPDAAPPSVAADGTLVYALRPPSGERSVLRWVGRDGTDLGAIAEVPARLQDPRVSPDGRRLVYGRRHDEDPGIDLWVRDLDRDTETRLTVDGGFKFNPRWTPDGTTVIYGRFAAAEDRVATWTVAADGSDEPRLLADNRAVSNVTPDGRHVLVVRPREDEDMTNPDAEVTLAMMPIDGEGETRALFPFSDTVTLSAVSPDGRWLAFRHERGDRAGIALTRFPEISGRWPVSTGDRAGEVVWSPGGDAILFLEDTTVHEVSFRVEAGEPKLGRPTPLFELPPPPSVGDPFASLAIDPDGERIVIVAPPDDPDDDTAVPAPTGIKVVQNWHREFTR